MSRIPKNAKRDQNEAEIIETFRAAGCAVLQLSAVGMPDLAVFRGDRLLALVEVKSRRGKLTPPQVRWRASWRGPEPILLRSVEETLTFLRGVR